MLDSYYKNKIYNPRIAESPNGDLGIIVVIPSYNEPELEGSLLSLLKCNRPKCIVEVIIVVNYPENSAPEILVNSKKSIDLIGDFRINHKESWISFHCIFAPDLPKKHAGVGLARKIGMDEAAWRFSLLDRPNGVIVCFDADSNCAENYLVEIEKLWQNFPKTTACSIKFAHPTTGDQFSKKIFDGIIQYELHLRYYYQACRFIKFPFSYHTIGSSMACTTKTYLKFGGMNKNQAGEDFYFLQKIIPHGNFRELNSTCVYPSPRPSFRVPFGTGRAISKYIDNDESKIYTYNLESFITIGQFFEFIELFYNYTDAVDHHISSLPSILSNYLNSINAAVKIDEVKRNTTNYISFRKRFFLWFDAFQLLKYLNYVNENHYKRQPVIEEANSLLKLMSLNVDFGDSIKLLQFYRDLEDKG